SQRRLWNGRETGVLNGMAHQFRVGIPARTYVDADVSRNAVVNDSIRLLTAMQCGLQKHSLLRIHDGGSLPGYSKDFVIEIIDTLQLVDDVIPIVGARKRASAVTDLMKEGLAS